MGELNSVRQRAAQDVIDTLYAVGQAIEEGPPTMGPSQVGFVEGALRALAHRLDVALNGDPEAVSMAVDLRVLRQEAPTYFPAGSRPRPAAAPECPAPFDQQRTLARRPAQDVPAGPRLVRADAAGCCGGLGTFHTTTCPQAAGEPFEPTVARDDDGQADEVVTVASLDEAIIERLPPV